ncbi:hypothetical protein [Streptomyces sp. ISL-11]|uniref:hypothetical protein n=1 Tax=Streptomyces sp. ISL-11 TaxID=2819174 RepID=UPI001BE60B15|nr:hypothetical protein [Streptomyces sp. ISL-11]MBT2386754.1 hypothetical protein [Streptomyces sp. ISL-11]
MLEFLNGGGRSTGIAHEVLVLRDTEAVADAVREALAGASDEERPGLERAAALIAGCAARPEAEARAEWVRGVLAAAGVDPVRQEVRAIKAVRQAERGLSLRAAAELVREAKNT